MIITTYLHFDKKSKEKQLFFTKIMICSEILCIFAQTNYEII